MEFKKRLSMLERRARVIMDSLSACTRLHDSSSHWFKIDHELRYLHEAGHEYTRTLSNGTKIYHTLDNLESLIDDAQKWLKEIAWVK